MRYRLCLQADRIVAVFLISCWVTPVAAESDADPLISRIKAVGAEGAGNVDAGKAWRELVRLGPDALFTILQAIDPADPIAANWLRSAVDTIAERELAAGKQLPRAKLEELVKETKHAGIARRLAYDWLVKVDPTAPARLLPDMLADPGEELRREAVALALQNTKQLLDKKDKPAATAAFRKLLAAARDRDQVDAIAKTLKDLGESVDLAKHLGFVMQWQLVGPFDNTEGTGLQTAFPPEKNLDPTATFSGKKDLSLRWKEHVTADPYGVVDLNKALGKHMSATGYALATVFSAKDQPVQLRAGSNNAIKIFLNGKQIFFRDEYHHGMRMDQHMSGGSLKAGRNEILVKVCQNEQTEVWAQSWSFQLRVCDDLGGAVPLADGNKNK
jgi:hypothetical protein